MQVPTTKSNMVEMATNEMTRRFHTKEVPTLEDILVDACWVFDQDINRVKSKCKKEELVVVRHIYSYMAKKITNASLKEISLAVGGKEHTRILYNVQKVTDFLKVQDPDFIPKWNKYIALSKTWEYYSNK